MTVTLQRSESPHYSQSEAKLTIHCTEMAGVGLVLR